MGGFGSGNWLGGQRKPLVEESLGLAIKDFGGQFTPGTAGTFTWNRGAGSSSIGYRVSHEDNWRIVRLSYRWRDEPDVSIPVRLQTTRPHYGGRRWWFTCPLMVHDVPCQRRVAKLYSPIGQRLFGCRHCFALTYRSSQQAHKQERTARFLARELGADLDIACLLATKWCH